MCLSVIRLSDKVGCYMISLCRIVLIENENHLERNALAQFADRYSLQGSWSSLEDLLAGDFQEPTIALALYPSKTSKSFTRLSRVRPNQLEFIDIFVTRSTKGYAHTAGELHASAPDLVVQEALAIAQQKILQRTRLSSSEVHEDFYLQFNLVGRSQAFVKSTRSIIRVAQTDSRVLIRGETGTGKEAAARAIHHFSQRSSGPFVPINCGAFTDDMLLSELFGYKKGAFTGAYEDTTGLLEYANGGTLFLDEVDSLSNRAQVALLRFLQENEIRPIGGKQAKTVNVRIVAATNKDLKALVKAAQFREDLLFRLDILNINLPALRNRSADLLLISQHILSRIQHELERDAKYLGLAVIKEIYANKWQGNFRELESALLRAYLNTDSNLISDVAAIYSEPEFDEIPRKRQVGSFLNEKQSIVAKFEDDYIRTVLTQTKGNVTQAAQLAKKERRAFTRLMSKHGIDRSDYSNI